MSTSTAHPLDNTEYRELVERFVANGDITAQGLASANMIGVAKELLRGFKETSHEIEDPQARADTMAAAMGRAVELHMYGTYCAGGRRRVDLVGDIGATALTLRGRRRVLPAVAFEGAVFAYWGTRAALRQYWGTDENEKPTFEFLTGALLLRSPGSKKLAVFFTTLREDGMLLEAPGPRVNVEIADAEPLIAWPITNDDRPPAGADRDITEAISRAHTSGVTAWWACADLIGAALAWLNEHPSGVGELGVQSLQHIIERLPVSSTRSEAERAARRVFMEQIVEEVGIRTHYGLPEGPYEWPMLSDLFSDPETVLDFLQRAVGSIAAVDGLSFALGGLSKLGALAETALPKAAEHDRLRAQLGESLASFRQHAKENGADEKAALVNLHAVRDGDQWALHVRVLNAPDPSQGMRGMPFLWDAFDMTVGHPVHALVVALNVYGRTKLDFQAPKKEKSRTRPPTYKYHPIRFAFERAYVKQIDDRAAASRGPLSSESEKENVLNELNGVLQVQLMEANAKNMASPLRYRLLENTFMSMNAEVNLIVTYQNFVGGGRQIFAFPEQMIDAFDHTDTDEIPCSEIKAPYGSQYLYFGPRADLELEPGWLVDGAYVTASPGKFFQVTITAVPTDPAAPIQWWRKAEPIFAQSFSKDHMGMSLAHAVDEVLAEKLKELSDKRALGDTDITASVTAHSLAQGVTPPFAHIIRPAASNANAEEDALRARLPVYKRALSLAVNCLCYLTAYSDDIDVEYRDGAPYLMVQALNSAKEKDRAKATKELLAAGYRQVHFCGRRFVESLKEKDASGTQGAQWRRGHWKAIAHGKGRLLRKMGWIQAYRTHVDDGLPKDGRIYLVDDDEANTAAA